MRSRVRNSFDFLSVSALDLFASALGVFVLMAFVMLPFYLNRPSVDSAIAGAKAEIAVRTFAGMEEERRRAGRRKRRRDLPADVARLPHAGDDDLSAAGEHELHRADEAGIEPPRERRDRRILPQSLGAATAHDTTCREGDA